MRERQARMRRLFQRPMVHPYQTRAKSEARASAVKIVGSGLFSVEGVSWAYSRPAAPIVDRFADRRG
jgi:hypothetical protein